MHVLVLALLLVAASGLCRAGPAPDVFKGEQVKSGGAPFVVSMTAMMGPANSLRTVAER